jgi:hypothetical protein
LDLNFSQQAQTITNCAKEKSGIIRNFILSNFFFSNAYFFFFEPYLFIISCFRWARTLLEDVTGYYTGSVYVDKSLAMKGLIGEYEEAGNGRNSFSF